MIEVRAELSKEQLEHAMEQSDHDTIVSTVMGDIWPLYSRHPKLLQRAIAMLPSDVLASNPLLRILHPVTPVLTRTNRAVIPQFSDEAARSLTSEQLSFVMIAQIIAARVGGNEEASVRLARQLHHRILDSASDLPEHPNGPLWYFYLQIGSTFLAAGDTSRALVELAVASQLAELTSNSDPERFSLARTALTHAARGSLGEAKRMLDASRKMPAPGRPHRRAINESEIVTEALIEVEHMSPRAADTLDQLESSDSNQLTWRYALLARTRFLIASKRPDFALEAIYHTRDTHPTHRGRFTLDLYESALIDAHLIEGDLAEARRIASHSERTAPLTRLALIRLALHTGDHDSANRRLDEIVSHSRSGVTHRIETALLTAWTQFARTGKLDQETANRLLQYGVQPRNRRLFAFLPFQLIDEVKSHVSTEEADALTRCLTGVLHRDVPYRPKLTSSELRVLQSLTQHHTTAEIAESLFISPNTVKSHLQSLYRKLGCSTREEAMHEAERMSLVHSDAHLTAPKNPEQPEQREQTAEFSTP